MNEDIEKWEEVLKNFTPEERAATAQDVLAKLASVQPMHEDVDLVAAWKAMGKLFGHKWEE